MFRVCLLIAAVAVLAVGAAGAPAQQTALPAASPQSVLAHAAALSQRIGPRVAGEAGYARAVEYVEGQFRELGYQTERQPFPFQYFAARQSSLRVVTPNPLSIETNVLYYSAPTPAQGVDAPLAQASIGRPEDLRTAGVAGRIALVERGELTFAAKAENAAAAGALAVVIFNHRPGEVRGTLLSPSRIPAVTISREDGERLLALLARGEVRVHLLVDTIVEQRTTWNIIGRRTGRDGRIVVIGGHLDTVAEAPGANDNGSGVAAALEAARLLARVPLPLTIEIIGFGGEEIGLLGSAHYVRERGRQVAAMINMDMVGRGSLMIGNSGADDRMVDLAARIAGRLELGVRRFRLGSSDHVSFERAGIPAVFIHTGDDPEMHTPRDVLERLDPQRMAQAALLSAATALEAADVTR